MSLSFKVNIGGCACFIHDIIVSHDVMHDIIHSSYMFINMCVWYNRGEVVCVSRESGSPERECKSLRKAQERVQKKLKRSFSERDSRE